MSDLTALAEARASALSLRASAKACTHEQGALMFRLTRAAESLDAVVGIAARALGRVKQLEQKPFTPTALEAMCGALAALEGKPCRQQAIDDLRVAIAAEERQAREGEHSASLLHINSALDSDDYALLLLALEMLDRHAVEELTEAANSTKHAAVLATRSHIAVVSGKLRQLQAGHGQDGAQ